jgi:hypothetical protein
LELKSAVLIDTPAKSFVNADDYFESEDQMTKEEAVLS